MKVIFSFFIFSFICLCIASAKPDEKLQPDLVLGINLTQCIAGDFELHARYNINAKHGVTLGIGYDANFLDFAKHWSEDKQYYLNTQEAESNEAGRYFWGSGPAIRLMYDFNFEPSIGNHSNYFISVAAMYKIHNYKNYYFGDGYAHCESADQKITGLSLYMGKCFYLWRLILRGYAGAGYRHLESKIYWPEVPVYNYTIPSTKFKYSLESPTLDFGLIVLWGKTQE